MCVGFALPTRVGLRRGRLNRARLRLNILVGLRSLDKPSLPRWHLTKRAAA